MNLLLWERSSRVSVLACCVMGLFGKNSQGEIGCDAAIAAAANCAQMFFRNTAGNISVKPHTTE